MSSNKHPLFCRSSKFRVSFLASISFSTNSRSQGFWPWGGSAEPKSVRIGTAIAFCWVSHLDRINAGQRGKRKEERRMRKEKRGKRKEKRERGKEKRSPWLPTTDPLPDSIGCNCAHWPHSKFLHPPFSGSCLPCPLSEVTYFPRLPTPNQPQFHMEL